MGQKDCVNYQRFNLQTESDAHPMQDLHNMVRGKGDIFSTLDLKSGNWQVSVTPEVR